MGRFAPGVIVYLYTVGVVLTGVYLERTWGGIGQTALVAASLGLALAWTVYYDVVLRSRIRRLSAPGGGWRPSAEGNDGDTDED